MPYSRYLLPPLLLALVVAAGCDTTDTSDGEPLQAVRVDDLPADPTTGRDSTTGAAISTNRHTFFSLRSGTVVLGYDAAERADSNSTAWDIGFRGTSLIFNGGASGPGEGGAVMVEDVFENVTEAPESGYAATLPAEDAWYNYNPQTHIVTPVPGRTIVVRTADGRYGKLRILSYYEGAPAEPTQEDAARYYTFEYVFQEDGSRDLSTE